MNINDYLGSACEFMAP
ncbi:hypothetical protein MTR67_031669 [Solanum verrucosum]|uniref:Uncharacterized protein n=1 Tax=Solanum verrucosum TaxID=315347 RepID=A0AAF0ZHY9_SOLVR|nr:hypothetical protein MTR67_031669 [Solanum verrucosum]